MILSKNLIWPVIFISPLLIAETFSDEDFDLDALMGMDVQATSAMKRAQSAFETASSIYVLNKEQIINSGATSIPEALKLVPGLIVRQLDNNQYAISTRGLASRFSSKLLVMIDGQSLYTPQFSAVYWEALNVPLYDIERIEVIRGQGGLLWGSNANNGVINIITKNSLDTRGIFANATTGNLINSDANFRYGGDIGSNGSYRVYGHIKNVNASKKSTAYKETLLAASDTNKQHSIGFRADFTPNDAWDLMFQGDITKSKIGQNLRAAIGDAHQTIAFSENFKRTDSRVMARIDNRISADANQMIQVSWLKQSGSEIYLKEEFESIDIDYQMNFIYQSLQLDWGLSYRNNDVASEESILLNIDKGISNIQQYGGLFQIQYSFIPDKINLTLGTKLDHNDLTGWENQPSARLIYKPIKNHLAWAAVSRSIRTPALVEFDYNFKVTGVSVADALGTNTGVDMLDNLLIPSYLNGNDQVESENFTSYELGYRISESQWSIDISAFHTDAENVAVYEPNNQVEQFYPALALLQAGQIAQAAQALTRTQLNFDIISVAESTTKGFDIVLAWQPFDSLNAELGYSLTNFAYQLPAGTSAIVGNDSINRQVFVKANYALSESHKFLAALRVENSTAYNTENYTALDLTWNWQINSQWSAAISGKNLFAGSHLEFNNTQEAYTIPTYIDESIAFTITTVF